MKTKLRLSTLSFAAFNLTAALDKGLIHKITFDELYREIENGNLIKFLEERLDDYDWSLFGPEFDQGPAFVEAIQRVAEVLKGRERRKMGIQYSGVCLLLSFCIEVMQHPENYQ